MSRTWALIGVTNSIPAVDTSPTLVTGGVVIVAHTAGNPSYEGIEISGRATAGNPTDKLVLLRKEILDSNYRFVPVKPDKACLPLTESVSGWFNFQFFIARSAVGGEYVLYCPASLVMGTANLERPRYRVF